MTGMISKEQKDKLTSDKNAYQHYLETFEEEYKKKVVQRLKLQNHFKEHIMIELKKRLSISPEDPVTEETKETKENTQEDDATRKQATIP